ncbi:MAG: extracellular solute-binding protein, partial [Anaerolineaceae bacterium]|nr:extracellular solute-binding protein [Anaerolineaceae bacterium]
MNTQKYLRLLIPVLVIALLAACSSPATEPAAEPAADTAAPEVVVPQAETTEEVESIVTVSFWHNYNEESPENEMLTKTLIPLFEEANPGIKIESLSVAYPDFRTKLMTAIAGGVAPDLIRVDIIWVPEFADMGALAALDEIMPDFDEYAEQVFPGPLSTNYWNGHYYGLPLDTNTKVML